MYNVYKNMDEHYTWQNIVIEFQVKKINIQLAMGKFLSPFRTTWVCKSIFQLYIS